MTTKPANGKDASPRKKYETPRLEIYGDIHQITQNVGTQAKKNDNGARPRNKTG